MSDLRPPESPRPGVPRRQVLRIFAAAGVSLALGGALTGGFLRASRLRRYSRTEIRMGTRVTMTMVHPEVEGARRMVDSAFAEMARLEAILSRYRPEGPLARLEARGVLPDPPVELVEVLRGAGELSEASGGAFDVTVAPLLRLYQGSHREGRAELPTPAEVARALALVDFRRLRVSEDELRLDAPGMHITLDGIAKGYILDRTVARLRSEGAERVLVEAGGDLGSAGEASEGEGWTIAIQDPGDPGRAIEFLRLRGEGVATSGDYIHAFTPDRRLHHILDPRTGESPTHTSAVTVMARGAMEADALSTAAFVLGPVEGRKLLEGRMGAEGLWIDKEGWTSRTSGFPAGAV